MSNLLSIHIAAYGIIDVNLNKFPTGKALLSAMTAHVNKQKGRKATDTNTLCCKKI